MQRLGKQPTSQRANPHSCRENWPVSTPGMIVAGSSPLTRGKRSGDRVPQLVPGLIPAHAGKTHKVPPTTRGQWAHPRSRGENPVGGGISSFFSRLIPAHAGKTHKVPPTTRGQWAHPRSRGENSQAALPRRTSKGSSPLTRGKPCPS